MLIIFLLLIMVISVILCLNLLWVFDVVSSVAKKSVKV